MVPAGRLAASSVKLIKSGERRDPAEWLQMQLLVEALLNCLLLHRVDSGPSTSHGRAFPQCPVVLRITWSTVRSRSPPASHCPETTNPPGKEWLDVCEHPEEMVSVRGSGA